MVVKKDEPKQSEINIGLVGHVDHGKTSLTKSLTGKWTDTHSEELKKGISIRLGYADVTFRKCPKCDGSEAYTTLDKCAVHNVKTKPVRRVSFVDAPGHETLMTTMLSGAALMQGAVLVIAANEKCPQPRTVEHLMALKMAGIKNIVVAQNKADIVEKEQALENYNSIKKFLNENGYSKTPIIPTAANFGINVDLLIEAIETNIKTPKYNKIKKFKMYVARSFDVNKPGTKVKDLVGGTFGGFILQGSVKAGDKIEIKPGIDSKTITTSVTSVSTEKGIIKSASPGGLVAIGTSLDFGITKNDEMRGQVLGVVGSLPDPVLELKLELEMFERLLTNDATIKVNDSLILTVGTATTIGHVTKISDKVARVALKVPVIVEEGQKVAISKRIGASWRLVAYGIIKN